MLATEERCELCACWDRCDDTRSYEGRCRRHAPVLVTRVAAAGTDVGASDLLSEDLEGRWPRTTQKDWCWEYQCRGCYEGRIVCHSDTNRGACQ
jgi:hypothetical protein